MEDRKLATIQVTKDIRSIPDADSIDVCDIKGWHCVVKKGEFNIGDKIVFVEVDSVLPHTNPVFEFMRDRKFRVKTLKLRKQVSQGLVFPTSILPVDAEPLYEGVDVTELLGIIKYEPPIPAQLMGQIIGNFPTYLVPKTDEERCQNYGDMLDKYSGIECGYCEKLDGSSFTAILNDGKFRICSRNLELAETEGNAYWKAARLENIEGKLKDCGIQNVALQGELIGMGIQGNKYALNQIEIWAFNIFDIDNQKYLSNEEVTKFCNDNGFKRVPVLGTVNITSDIDSLVELSKGKSKLNPKRNREGIVIRSVNEIHDPEYGRFSFKCINPDFLLKDEE